MADLTKEILEENYEFRNLNFQAIKFIEKSLNYSGILSDNFINKCKSGKMWTIVKKNLDEKELYEFEYGDKMFHEDRPYVSELVFSILKNDVNKSWIIINYSERVEYTIDENRIEDVTRPFYYNNIVFHFMEKKPLSAESIELTIKAGGWYPFIGFITEIDDKIKNNIYENKVTESDIEIMRDSISFFVLGCYDEESYIFIEMNTNK